MGILNVTPDSFSDGGLYRSSEAAVAAAHRMQEEGADILDVGGESTRPGAPLVTADEEAARVLPVLRELQPLGLPISLDSRRPAVIRAALDIGIDLVNDVSGLRDPEMLGLLPVLAQQQIGLCVMHMKGEPQTMQLQPKYDDVVAEVTQWLAERTRLALDAGLQADQLLVDPGFGFGKLAEHHSQLMQALPDLAASLQLPLLVGLSRKRWMAELGGIPSDLPPSARLVPSLVAALAAARAGAAVLRVHDVLATRQMLAASTALGLLSPPHLPTA